MKRIILSIGAFLFIISCFGQDEPVIRGTLKPGSTPNSVVIAILPSKTFTGTFTNVQFTIEVPNSVSPIPNMSIKNNFMSTFVPTYLPATMTNENGFYNFLFSATTSGAPAFNFVNGTEVDFLEVQFNGSRGTTTGRLAHLPNGGTTLQMAFYIEVGGFDKTNYSNMFYGSGATNGGGIDQYSFVPLANVSLPVSWLRFDVAKRNNDAELTWKVTNEDRNREYQVERSADGKKFVSLGTLPAKNGVSNSINSYLYVDKDVVSLRKPILYYRLKQTDVDGKVSYSKIYSLRFNEKAVLINLFPNPARVQTVLNIDLPKDEKVSIRIQDIYGQTVFQETKSLGKGLNQKVLYLSQFAAGSYNVYVQSASIKQTFKLLIE